jgi:hypothetical protein
MSVIMPSGTTFLKIIKIMTLRFLVMLALIFLQPSVPYAAEVSHDPRALTDVEIKTFVPLLCRSPVFYDAQFNCDKIINYPSPDSVDDNDNFPHVDISLIAITYGAFTASKVHEAYVSYTSSFEPHATNFGGGILFDRVRGRWRLIRWYPGGQMDHCLSYSAGVLQEMLCLSGYTGQGQIYSSVSVMHVSEENDNYTVLVKAQDDREDGSPEDPNNEDCERQREKDEVILLSVDTLYRTHDSNFFAEATVTYALPEDITMACDVKNFSNVKETKGVVRFSLQDGKIKAVTPAKFANIDD